METPTGLNYTATNMHTPFNTRKAISEYV